MLQAQLESLEGVEESVAGFYKQDEATGKYNLQVTPVGGFALENVAGLKETLADRKAKAAERKTALAAFEGIDPEKARAALAKVDEIANWTPDQQQREIMEARENDLRTKFEAELETERGRTSNYKTQLEEKLIRGAAVEAIAAAGGNAKLLLPHVVERMKLTEGDDGKFAVKIVDDNGNPRVSMKENSEGDMGLDELIEILSNTEEFMPAFAGSGASGGGAGGSDTPGRGGSVEFISFTDAQDAAKYQAAKKRAKERGVPLEVGDHPNWKDQPSA